MARKINTLLTREMLEEMGIKEVIWNEEAFKNQDWENQWNIWRDWFVNKSKVKKKYDKVRISKCERKHKYVPTTVYLKVQFNYKGKGVSIPLGRFIYAWFGGKAKDGYEIDHKNNNKFDNSLDNLQQLTPEENKRKRYLDNPQANHNQWTCMSKVDKEIWERHKWYRKQLKELKAIGEKK